MVLWDGRVAKGASWRCRVGALGRGALVPGEGGRQGAHEKGAQDPWQTHSPQAAHPAVQLATCSPGRSGGAQVMGAPAAG